MYAAQTVIGFVLRGDVPDPIEFLPHPFVLANPRASRPVAIEGILGVGDLAVITGSHDSFKSTLALELAWSLSTGKPWLGHKPFRISRRLRMGVLQTEIDEGAYDERCARFPPAESLHLCTALDFTLDRLLELSVALDDGALDGIVLDPLGQVWPSMSRNGEPFSENTKNHVTPLFRELKGLRKTVILCHHDPKASAGFQGRASGSAAILNDPDVRIFVDRKRGTNKIQVSVLNRLQRPTPDFEAEFDEDTMRLSVTNTAEERLSEHGEDGEDDSTPPRKRLPSSRFVRHADKRVRNAVQRSNT